MDREAPATRFFSPTRDREACSAIRGYVYQIDRTIDRWLNLSSDQRLELERGEDIDIVGQCMLVDDSSRETRLLEQVKHRERRITLRTDCALEALANFHDHCASNPQLDLRFCFVTNATIGREQLDPFPNHAPGIALWEQIRCANLPKDQIPGALASLRRFIA